VLGVFGAPLPVYREQIPFSQEEEEEEEERDTSTSSSSSLSEKNRVIKLDRFGSTRQREKKRRKNKRLHSFGQQS
jgi:hypothetical protein